MSEKISQMTPLPTPLQSGDVFPVVRGTENFKADADDLPQSGNGDFEYQPEITSSSTILELQKGLNKVYPFNKTTPQTATVNNGVYVSNDVINFERRDASVQIIQGDNVRFRGERDINNNFFIDHKDGISALLCRGNDGTNDVFTAIGFLKGSLGAVTTSNYTNLAPTETNDVTVTGTSFSENMIITVTGNATLNSWAYVNTTTITLNLTSSGVSGDFITVIYDNGDVFEDTDAIELETLEAFVIETTSTSATWSPTLVTHTGSTLTWTVTGDASGTYNADDPTIDLSGNTGTAIITVTDITTLTVMYLNSLNITSLDVSALVDLTTLRCFSNQLTTLDLSSNASLQIAYCYSNPSLSNINISGLTNLTQLRVQSCGLSTLDTTTNTNLDTLHIQNNNLSTQPNFDSNTLLVYLNMGNNTLSSISLDNNTSLEELYISGNSFAVDPNVALLTNLTLLDVSSNASLSALDVSLNTALEELYIQSCNFTSINISSLTALTIFYCYSNSLTSLDVTSNVALVTLWNYSNSITTLDLSNNVALSDVNCRENAMTVSGVNNVIIDSDRGITTGTLKIRYDGSNAAPTLTEVTTNDVIDAYNNMLSDGYNLVGSVPA